MQFPSIGFTGRGLVPNRGSSGTFAVNERTEAANFDPLVGRKVWTRWPEDNNFYEAVITDYNPVEGRHALVYDISTADKTWEWVNLKEVKDGPFSEFTCMAYIPPDGDHQLQGQSMDQERWRKQQYDDHTGEGNRVVEGSDANKMATDGRVGSGGENEKQHPNHCFYSWCRLY
ncbi:uncharacterized protein LOC114318627 [Camellia sinensis]|uniref:uncharacterized protein LOC114318627 n=1 Tax=Camellia sinensis TaxID=4442 RepID=UPI001035D6B0|nr:uncharacterized protein LOC114318627 [Camellia sinensis]